MPEVIDIINRAQSWQTDWPHPKMELPAPVCPSGDCPLTWGPPAAAQSRHTKNLSFCYFYNLPNNLYKMKFF